MSASRFPGLAGRRVAAAVAAVLLVGPVAPAQDKEKPDTDKIPKRVMDALKGKFPKAEIREWSKEKEGDVVVYDIEFRQAGKKYEADIRENGTFHNWEKEITARDLPDAVRKTLATRYPGAAFTEVMEITAVKDGKDALEGYEVGLTTADKKAVEVTVAPDGKVLEEELEEEK